MNLEINNYTDNYVDENAKEKELLEWLLTLIEKSFDIDLNEYIKETEITKGGEKINKINKIETLRDFKRLISKKEIKEEIKNKIEIEKWITDNNEIANFKFSDEKADFEEKSIDNLDKKTVQFLWKEYLENSFKKEYKQKNHKIVLWNNELFIKDLLKFYKIVCEIKKSDAKDLEEKFSIEQQEVIEKVIKYTINKKSEDEDEDENKVLITKTINDKVIPEITNIQDIKNFAEIAKDTNWKILEYIPKRKKCLVKTYGKERSEKNNVTDNINKNFDLLDESYVGNIESFSEINPDILSNLGWEYLNELISKLWKNKFDLLFKVIDTQHLNILKWLDIEFLDELIEDKYSIWLFFGYAKVSSRGAPQSIKSYLPLIKKLDRCWKTNFFSLHYISFEEDKKYKTWLDILNHTLDIRLITILNNDKKIDGLKFYVWDVLGNPLNSINKLLGSFFPMVNIR